jgi:hypothetical protein
MDTMDTVIIHPGIMAIMDTVIMDPNIMVTTGEEDMVTAAAMDIIDKEAGPITFFLVKITFRVQRKITVMVIDFNADFRMFPYVAAFHVGIGSHILVDPIGKLSIVT